MTSELPLKSTCILQSSLNCGGSNKPLMTAGPDRLCSIVDASKCRGDGLHLDLKQIVHDCGSSSLLLHFLMKEFVLLKKILQINRHIHIHRNCVST